MKPNAITQEKDIHAASCAFETQHPLPPGKMKKLACEICRSQPYENQLKKGGFLASNEGEIYANAVCVKAHVRNVARQRVGRCAIPNTQFYKELKDLKANL